MHACVKTCCLGWLCVVVCLSVVVLNLAARWPVRTATLCLVLGSHPAFRSLEAPWLMGSGPDPDHPEQIMIGIGLSLTSWKIRLLLASWQNFEHLVEIP